MKSISVSALFFTFLICSFAISCSNLYAQHKKYTEKDMPDEVISSFQKYFPGAEVLGYDKETENGTTTYEVECISGDRKDIQFEKDGTIIEIEEEMNISDLPEKVVTSLNNNYNSPEILKTEKVTKGNDTLFEVVIKYKKKKHEIRLDKEGNILEKE